jgi:hypothetical protein
VTVSGADSVQPLLAGTYQLVPELTQVGKPGAHRTVGIRAEGCAGCARR